ncbi:MAG: V-type ATP synthase subunit F [Clostridia bacterium]|nr:V-type ATP synthase subunit F [Clostridia bacterium]
MIHISNIGVIGDYDSVFGFSAVGFRVAPVSSAEQARAELKVLAGDGIAVIFITEPYMEALASDCAAYDDQALPCIVSIPACGGGTGFGESRLKRFVERAVGSDLLFGDQ